MFFCTLTCIDCIYKTLNLIYDSTKKYWTCSSAKTRNCPPSPLQWHVENSHPFLSTSVVPGKKVLSTRWFTVDSDSGSMGWQHHLHHFWESRSENKIHQNPYTAGWLEHHNIWFFPAPCLKNCILTPVKLRSTKAWKKKSVMVDDSPSLLPDHPLPSLGNRSQHPHLCVRSALKSIEICKFLFGKESSELPATIQAGNAGLGLHWLVISMSFDIWEKQPTSILAASPSSRDLFLRA